MNIILPEFTGRFHYNTVKMKKKKIQKVYNKLFQTNMQVNIIIPLRNLNLCDTYMHMYMYKKSPENKKGSFIMIMMVKLS